MIRKEILKEVIESQREWILKQHRGVEREKLSSVKHSKSFAMVISGIRRCGKSTLLSQVLSRQNIFYYLNLEDPRLNNIELMDLNKTENIFKELYGEGGTYFLDEIQTVKLWEKFVRYLVDKKKEVIITGSNASLLSRELGTRLTGRHIRIELFPFSYREFLKFHNAQASKKSFEKYLLKGGFPEYLKQDDPAIHYELLNDVVARDIAVRFGIKNVSLLKNIATYLISHVGKPFSYNSIRSMFGIKSVQSVIDYISYFEDSYILFTIPIFSYSYKKQQVNPKKAYSIDNGFSYSNTISFSKDKGKMLENCVFLHLRRIFREIFYFVGQGECDFVIKEKEKITQAVQVCYELTETNEKREINGLIEAMEKFKLSQGYILTLNQDDELDVKNKKIIVKPVWRWLIESEAGLKKIRRR